MRSVSYTHLVQPILENAIYYGMEAMDDDGIISVRGYQKDGDVFLEISDNGLGMPEEAAAKLLTEGERVRSRGSGEMCIRDRYCIQ